MYKLRQVYGPHINFSNKSVAGTMAQWGKDNATKLVTPENPDLVIIGFGMSDGSTGIPPEKFRETIKQTINTIKIKNRKAEFILIALMLANPDAIQSNIQASHIRLNWITLPPKEIVIADLTGVDIELLKHKNYQNKTGNNINYPNGYMSRWYA